MRVGGIIFDYGGTLDSRGDHWSEVIWRAYLAERSGVERERFREAYVYAERTLEGSGIILPGDNFLELMRKKIALQTARLGIDSPTLTEAVAQRCYESARECVGESAVTLRELARRYPLAVVSNFYGNIRAVLDDFGILPLFKAVIDSTEAGIRKPDPAIFRLGADALGLEPQDVLVVGDSIGKDILPARSLGCRTALLPGTPWDPSREQPSVPSDTVTLSALSDLTELLHK